MKLTFFIGGLLLAITARAELVVTASANKVSGSKVVIPLSFTNGLGGPVESVRAAAFVADESGKVVGRGAQWIIGGTDDLPALPAGGTNLFLFVVTLDRPPTSTNLTTRLLVNRIILQGGKLGDPKRDVVVRGPQ